MGIVRGAARQPGVDPEAPPKASCHPRRTAFLDGLCRGCFERQMGGGAEGALAATRAAEIQVMAEAVQDIEELGRKARTILQTHLPQYALLHYQGAQIAASKGDTRPAEWALQAVKTPKGGAPVEPPAKTAPETGIKVFIGVGLGNMPAQAITAQVVELPPLPPDSVSNE